MPRDRDADPGPIMEVPACMEALRESSSGTDSHALHCPKATVTLSADSEVAIV